MRKRRKTEVHEATRDNEDESALGMRFEAHESSDDSTQSSGTEQSRVRKRRKQTYATSDCRKIRQHHSFRHMNAGGQSRVHCGDAINTTVHVNVMNLSDLTGLLHKADRSALHQGDFIAASATRDSQCTTRTVQAGITTILATLKCLFSGCTLRWGTIFSTLKLPKQLVFSPSLAVLEDVWGHISYIDPCFITTWSAFDSVLQRQFENRRGYARVKNGKYRLMDRESKKLINPRHLPDFKIVFGQGRYLRMTIHFDQEEVGLDSCPKCCTQISLTDSVETTCPTCAFWFITELKPKAPCPSLGEKRDWSYWKKWLDDAQLGPERPLRRTQEKSDRPEHFNRISVDALLRKDIVHGSSTKGPVEMGQSSSEPPSSSASSDHVSFTNGKTMISCNNIWNQLQSNPNFLEGKFDLDSLCSELRSKARCSESGVIVDQDDVDAAFRKLSKKGDKTPDELQAPQSLMFEQTSWDTVLSKLRQSEGSRADAQTTANTSNVRSGEIGLRSEAPSDRAFNRRWAGNDAKRAVGVMTETTLEMLGAGKAGGYWHHIDRRKANSSAGPSEWAAEGYEYPVDSSIDLLSKEDCDDFDIVMPETAPEIHHANLAADSLGVTTYPLPTNFCEDYSMSTNVGMQWSNNTSMPMSFDVH